MQTSKTALLYYPVIYIKSSCFKQEVLVNYLTEQNVTKLFLITVIILSYELHNFDQFFIPTKNKMNIEIGIELNFVQLKNKKKKIWIIIKLNLVIILRFSWLEH